MDENFGYYSRLVVLLISKPYHNHYSILNEFNKGKFSEDRWIDRIQLAIFNRAN